MNWVERALRRLDPEGWARTDEDCARSDVLVAHYREKAELYDSINAELRDPNISDERLVEIAEWLVGDG